MVDEEQFQVDVEGFYNFYAVPWNSDQYVKFPCPHLGLNNDPKAGPVFAASEHVVSDGDYYLYKSFMDGYLGSARLTDSARMKKITEYRSELVLPE